MKILVFGKTGQVAQELAKSQHVTLLDRNAANLTDPTACAELINTSDADIVINAAAYTAVDNAEQDVEIARLINADAPTAMANACAKADKVFIHISTDYVFDGTGSEARTEDDPTGPLGVYGSTKLAGEAGVIAAGGRFAILRTSWVFSAHGSNFVKTMLRLGSERDALNIVSDQIGGPTPAADIASAAIRISASMARADDQNGIYHFSGAPNVSWADFARTIFHMSGLTVNVTGIPTAEYPTPAKRPLNSRLDCAKISRIFGINRPDWRDGLRDVLTELETE